MSVKSWQKLNAIAQCHFMIALASSLSLAVAEEARGNENIYQINSLETNENSVNFFITNR